MMARDMMRARARILSNRFSLFRNAFPWIRGSQIAGWTGIGIRECVQDAAAYLQVPLLVLSLGNTGCSVGSIVNRVPASLLPP